MHVSICLSQKHNTLLSRFLTYLYLTYRAGSAKFAIPAGFEEELRDAFAQGRPTDAVSLLSSYLFNSLSLSLSLSFSRL